MSDVYIDLSIGPVQGFVAQSRRTRDLWGSSYLLSFLSAHAIRGGVRAGEGVELVRPNVDKDPLYRWACGHRNGTAPVIGSVPNHFIIKSAPEDVDAVVLAVKNSLVAVWERICTAVWERFVAHAAPSGVGTRAIWERQTLGYWEVVWTVGEQETSGELARRKYWRTHRLADEPGDKCTVMSELQELSGYTRACSAQERADQDVFWASIVDPLGPLDLREQERLSAIALVKRLYTKVSEGAIGWQVDASTWPSTVHIGASPWIREVSGKAPDEAAAYVEAVKRLADAEVFSERPMESCIRAMRDFARLDANYFHGSFISEPRLCPLRVEDDRQGREELRRCLKKIYEQIGGPPPIYYALLLADGDRLGDLVRGLGGQAVGAALSCFTSKVQRVVREHGGVTIYAGGDDVLAMLPVDGALGCARALATTYAESFEGLLADAETAPTLSAAVSLAHMRLPMRAALDTARTLLDDVAKAENGRDSIAVAVLKRGGVTSQWVSTWSRSGESAIELLDALASELRTTDASERGFSSSLLHRLRDTLGLLCDWPGWGPGRWQGVPAEVSVEMLRAFVYAEVLRSVSARMEGRGDDEGEGGETEGAGEALSQRVTDCVVPLLFRCRSSAAKRRAKAGGEDSAAIGMDALTLARFLASGGREEDDS